MKTQEGELAQQSKINEVKVIRSIISDALQRGHAFGLWRQPESDEKILLVCPEVTELDELSIEDSLPGFAFAPFDRSKKKLFLPADKLYRFRKGSIISDESEFEFLAEPLDEEQSNDLEHFANVIPDPVESGAEAITFQEMVALGIERIKQGELQKVVPSRRKTVTLPREFDLLNTFEKLCASYPHAFVSLVSTKQAGTWIGASPELLVSVDRNMKFRTTAVAGTQPYPYGKDLKEVAWTQKEIEEQALVSRYIINCLKRIRLREFQENGPKTWTAGNLIHLRTDIEVDMVATNFMQLGTVMLNLLHPTSAICGMPLDNSIQFLGAYENYDRQFYSGFLGPININQESSVYVNLRCMQVGKSNAFLYAGAGVTEDSIPQKEWEETEIKMNTLLTVLKS